MANSFFSILGPGGKFLADKLGKGGNQIPVLPQWQQDLGKNLGTWAQQYLSQYNPAQTYQGQLSAEMSDFEGQGLDQLQGYLNAPGTGDLFNQAQGQISDTLSGKYTNPQTNPFIQGMMPLFNQNLNDQLNQSRAQAGARGNFFSSPAIRNEGLIRERSLNNLNSIIGEIQQQERQNQIGAASTAQRFDQYANQTIPLAKIEASQTYGSLPRLLEQADFERQYNEFSRQQGALSQVPGIAQGAYNGGQAPAPAYITQPNQFGQTLQSLIGLFGQVAPLLKRGF